MAFVIDADTHFLPRDAFDDPESQERFGSRWPRYVWDTKGRGVVDFPERWDQLTPLQRTMVGNHHFRPHHAAELDSEVRVKWLDSVGFDMQVLVPSPAPFPYALEPEIGLAACRSYNNAIGRVLKKHPGRFVGLALVPLQDPVAAVRELKRAVLELGMHAPVIFSNVRGRNLDEPSLWSFYSRVEQLDVPLIIHAHRFDHLLGIERLTGMHLDNTLGFMYEATLAITCLIMKGVLDTFPRLRVGLLETGGGWLPNLMDRLQEIYETETLGGVLPAFAASTPLKDVIRKAPEEYVDQFWLCFNVCYENRTMPSVIQRFGADRFMVNSDFPHPMGGAGGRMVQLVQELKGVSEADKEQLLGLSACKLFGVDPITRQQARNGAVVAAGR